MNFMETYQPIYDAVRSRIGNSDIGEAVQTALREANLGHYANMAFETIRAAVYEYERPSVIYRPTLSLDGNMWCALYGVNLQEGCAGFGASPHEAMRDFDTAWCTKFPLTAPAKTALSK